MDKRKKAAAANTFSVSEQDRNEYLRLHRHIEWMRRRQEELQVCINYEKLKKETFENESMGDEIDENVDLILSKLKKNADKEAVYSTIIPKYQLADTLYTICTGDLNPDEQIDENDVGVMQELAIEVKNISTKIMTETEEVDALEEEVLQLQLKLAETSKQRFDLMKSIHSRTKTNEEEDDSEAIKKLKSKMDKASTVIRINNYILQMLISRSGLLWSKDEELVNLMLECGKPLDEVLTALEAEEMQ